MNAHTTTLGRTGLTVSRIGLGAWGLGNSGAHPAVQVSDEAAMADLLRTSFELGVTLLDSAEAYDNEALLGRLIQKVGAPDDLLVSTKFGHGKGFSRGQIRESVERSLNAFGLSSIPLFMLHDPRNEADLETIYGSDGALPELRRLQDEGLVGSVGIATGTLPPLLAAVESDEFDVIQFPRLYTLLNRSAKTSGLLEKAKERGIGTILTSPFAGNVLGTGVRGATEPLYSFWAAQPEVVTAVAALQEAAEETGLALPEAAMAYALAEPLIDVVVIGVTTSEELRQDVAVLDRPVDPSDLDRIAAAGDIDQRLVGGPDYVWPFPSERMPADLKAKLGL